MRSAISNYLGMITIAVVTVLGVGALAVQIDRNQEPSLPQGIHATPAISGNAPSGLVDVRWLQQYGAQVDFIFDLSDIRQYEAGHIPGALHIWWQDAIGLEALNYGEADQISTTTHRGLFGQLNLGVPQNARIVLYDAHNSERASWLLWVMNLNGYSDVHVLDGGLAAWIAAGGEISTERADVPEIAYATPVWNESYEIRREPLLESLDEPNLRIVDTRSAEEYLDTVNGTIREGHIPGSINIPTEEIMRDDGTFKSPQELREIFASYGIEPDNNIVVYSLFTTHSGNMWLAFQIAGYDNVVIYMEGWVGWGFNTELPIETGPYPTSRPASTPVTTATPMATATPLSTPGNTEDEGPTDLTGD